MKVLASYLHPNVVSHSFMDSLWNLAEYDRDRERLLWTRFPVRSGPGSLDASRNTQVRIFLDQSPCEWLWLVDADMGFAEDTLTRLVAAADSERRPVVGALCAAVIEDSSDGMGGWRQSVFPTLYDATKDGFIARYTFEDLPKNRLVRTEGTGAACLLIHREVLVRMREETGDVWFKRFSNGPQMLGEDLSFCRRLGSLEIPIYVHTGIHTTHHKQVWVGTEEP